MNMVEKARNAMTKMIGHKPVSENGQHAWIVSTEADHSMNQQYAIVIGTDPKFPGLMQARVECHSTDADEKTRGEIENQVMELLVQTFPELYKIEDPTPPSVH